MHIVYVQNIFMLFQYDWVFSSQLKKKNSSPNRIVGICMGKLCTVRWVYHTDFPATNANYLGREWQSYYNHTQIVQTFLHLLELMTTILYSSIFWHSRISFNRTIDNRTIVITINRLEHLRWLMQNVNVQRGVSLKSICLSWTTSTETVLQFGGQRCLRMIP